MMLVVLCINPMVKRLCLVLLPVALPVAPPRGLIFSVFRLDVAALHGINAVQSSCSCWPPFAAAFKILPSGKNDAGLELVYGEHNC
jgi:hypothetical protein